MKKIFYIMICAIFICSCENEDTQENNQDNNYNAEEFSKSEEANKIAEKVNSIITKDYSETSSNKITSSNMPPYLPACVTRTYSVSGMTHQVIFDFGSTGCTMPNGNVITGQIVYTYIGDITTNTKTITYNLVNFTFNSASVVGSDIIEHIHVNANGNPQSTITVDFEITWPSGLVGNRTGSILREWIAGSDTLLDWTDDVFLVSGNWATNFTNGGNYTANITTSLMHPLTCWYFVSGTIDFNYNGVVFTGDYGDGTCNNSATLTFANGSTINIFL